MSLYRTVTIEEPPFKKVRFNPKTSGMVNASRRYKGYPRRSKRSGKKSVRSMVNRAIMARAETKFVQNNTVEELVQEGLAPTFYDMPNIPVGDNSAERIGNKIKCLTVGYKSLYNNNSTTASTWVREVFIEVDGGRYNLNSDIATALFEGGTDLTYSGDLTDMVNRIQKDGLRVLSDRTMHLGPDTIASFDQGNTGGKVYRKVNKTLIHRDQQTAQPTNKRYTLMILCRDPKNDAGVAQIEATIHREMYFKDL